MLPKAYDPKGTEDRIYVLWEESGAFMADAQSKKEPFVISMPPPNATGQLHLGHAVMLALEDIFIRFARMQGKEALWLPGTDHAAIATESVVIKKIQKEEKIKDPRAHYGREKLVQKIAEFVEQSRATIRSQVRKMGASCDWSRERYTLDASLNRCVNEVFKKMYEEDPKLIYRGFRVVNWDTALQTTISDDEIEHEEHEAVLYTFEYLSSRQTGGEPLYVATSRPETKLGDVAIAVHPSDERYQHLVGKKFPVRWPGGRTISITVIADSVVDPSFGTGAVGVTPFHSKIDEALWNRHKSIDSTEPIQVITENGKIFHTIEGYGGMTVPECREAFVEGLRKEGRLLKEEKYMQPLSISYRSKKPVEELPKLQWFIDVNKEAIVWRGGKKKMSLKQIMQEVIRSHDISIIPGRFEKTYFQWIDHLQDWCISRQIWWGHRVPAWYCKKCNKIFQATDATARGVSLKHPVPDYVGIPELKKCQNCGEKNDLEQDSDTLDTWFSSGLWTWSTLIDPALAEDTSLSLQDLLKKSPDFQKFHPTSVMETGYDILFFWVARMILMTTYATGQIPFKHVYLHGLVRTRDGKKMSKSDPSTCIDPLEIIPKYGADALRLSMIVGQSPGNDFRLYEEKIAGYRNFINKLWNASRFVLMQCEKAEISPKAIPAEFSTPNSQLSTPDRALLSSLQRLVENVTEGLKAYRLSEVGEQLYSFVWDFFCNGYLELSKGEVDVSVRLKALRTIVHLLHPYCPFVTEELWSQIAPEGAGLLIKEPWPVVEEDRIDLVPEKKFELLINVISAIQSLRMEYGVPSKTKIPAIVHVAESDSFLLAYSQHFLRLANIDHLEVVPKAPAHKHGMVSMFLKGADVHLSLEGVVDLAKVKQNLEVERAQLEKFLSGVRAKLSNEQFMERAKPEVVETEKQKLADGEAKLAKIEERLRALA
ncbi:MAG: valine--tRNA ligase [Candidatus Peribacter sp.]|jgi:valyl-tRNA synthetase